jgi:tRNA A-37 threonylcarbamoyl transferase component Bud32
MSQDRRISLDVTVAYAPADSERTQIREGGPRSADALASAVVDLQTTVEATSIVAEGGMAVVYRAIDRRLDRELAIKALKRDSSEIVRAGFEREAQLMARLDHPGIVPVHGMSPPDHPSRLFTMKLVEGRTIAEIIESARPPRGRALAVMLRSMLRMCETLAYAHDRGVIHRDLKPENVMLGRYGECYIMDWGVALELSSRPGNRAEGNARDESVDEIIGTPAFMAPEQARGRTAEIDQRTDVFGLGAILYFILTGHPPYAGGPVTQVLEFAREGRTIDLSSCELPIPARLSDIVSKALAPEQERRFATVMQMHEAIEQFLFTGEWFTRRRIAAGELIVREGERGDRAYIVESGECEVFRAGPSGELSIRRIGPGEVIGELALFTAGPRTASIRAITAMTLLEVTREALEQELPQGSWTRQIIDSLAQRFVSVDRDRGKTDQ